MRPLFRPHRFRRLSAQAEVCTLNSSRRRGSILLLVLVLLAVLFLLATTLVYMAKLELLAADNAARTIQTRMGAVTGVPAAIVLLAKQWGQPTALNQSWANTPQPPASKLATSQASTASKLASGQVRTASNPASKLASSQRSASNPTSETAALFPWPGWLDIQDAGALININAVLPYPQPGDSTASAIPGAVPARALENLIAQRLFKAGFSPAAAPGLAQLILDARWGPDGKPGGTDSSAQNAATGKKALGQNFGIKSRLQPSALSSRFARDTGAGKKEDGNAGSDPRLFVADLRESPAGDDRHFAALDDLRRLPGMPREAFDAIAPFLTVFSSSCEFWRDAGGEAYAPVSLNAATPDQLFEALQRLYPRADENLLRQFALNVADRRDPDSIPSFFPASSGSYPLLGYERTPIISEVCPDVITFSDDGDNGEFIEIYNPLPLAADLRNWRIDWGYGAHVLNVVLQPGACLVLTDDIQNANDPTPEDKSPHMGSFLEIFGVPLLGKNLLLEDFAMDIPDDAGVIRLFDGQGNLVDYLAYRSALFAGNLVGQRRRSRSSHEAEAGSASPFRAELREPSDPYAKTCREILEDGMNAPFRNPAELLAVPCPPSASQESADASVPFPFLGISGGQFPDLRLLDAFTASSLGETRGLRRWNADPTQVGGAGGEAGLGAADAETAALSEKDTVSFGKINLNTAPSEVLVTLPGMDSNLVEMILLYRAKTQESAQANVSSEETPGLPREDFAPFRSLSDFADNRLVWSRLDASQRLETLLALCPLVTFNSTAFLVKTNHPPDPAGTNEAPGPGLGCRALVNMTGSRAEVLDWRFWLPQSKPIGFQAAKKTTEIHLTKAGKNTKL